MSVFLELRGPGADKPKATKAKRWEQPEHTGVDRDYGGWVGLRADGLVIVDCDSDEAVARWRSIAPTQTYEVQTPRGGVHFYYKWTPGCPTGPDTDWFGEGSHIDVRAGNGSYVVCPPTPGYTALNERKPALCKSKWLGEKVRPAGDGEGEYDEIPDGRGNDTLAGIGGYLRRQGFSFDLINNALSGINKLAMSTDPMPQKDVTAIAKSVCRYDVEPDWDIELAEDSIDNGVLQWMSNMTMPPPPKWHWKPYLPEGRLVLLDGSEGIGKGLFCAYLTTLLTGRGDTVLWASTEDDPEEDIQRRLLAAGYSRETSAPVGFFTVDPKFPTHIEALEKLIAEHEAKMLVLDPGRSFLAPPEGVRASFNDEAAIRPGLESLNKLAKRSGCAIVFVHHWNKNTQTTTQYRAGGSGAFAQVVRHRITLAWHGPTDGGTGAFEVSKSNIAPKGGVHGYEVTPIPAYDTASILLTEPLDDFSDIGEWLKAQEAGEDTIELDRIDDIVDKITALPAGTPVPAVAALQAEFGVKRTQAKGVVDSLLEQGLVRRAGAGHKLFRVGEHERES